MKRVFYITRTLPDGNTGGAIIRRGTIKYLKENGYNVIIVAPSDHSEFGEERILIKGLASSMSIKWNMFLFVFGFYSDYMSRWAHLAFKRLKDVVKKEDVVLATSGGELGTLLLASLLKNKIGCRIVYNLHDPIQFTMIEGEFSYKSKSIIRPRDKAEKIIFDDADSIVTSSLYYAEILKRKYPNLAHRIFCHHFGYIEKIEHPQKEMLNNKRINIVYGGNMGKLQGPEILIKVAEKVHNVDFTLIGNIHLETAALPSNVHIMPLMKYDDYIHYLLNYADIGFFSLVGHISELCVPSKLYEYINAGIPVLAAIGGDAQNIIINNGFGVTTAYDADDIVKGVSEMLAEKNLESYKNNVLRNRDNWYMRKTINELLKVLS